MPAPNTPTDIIDRIRQLERRIDDLSGRMNIRPALNTIVGGSVTIKGGGSLIVKDVDNHTVMGTGRADPDVDGKPQMATIIRRTDGSLAFAVWTSATTGAQPVRIYDKNSRVVFADDLVAGGLAIPYLPLPLPVSIATASFYSTTSTTYTAVARSVAYLHHPRLYVYMMMSFGASTTGRFRLMVDGVQVCEGTDSLVGNYDIPEWLWEGVPQVKTIEIQLKRDSGTGTVSVQPRGLYGRQS